MKFNKVFFERSTKKEKKKHTILLCGCLLSNVYCVLRDKQVDLIGGQTGCPYWGTNRLPLLGDKQVALIGGQTGFPYCGINRFPVLGEKQVARIGGQTGHFLNFEYKEYFAVQRLACHI